MELTSGRRRRVGVPAVIAVAGLAIGSAAWACAPINDNRTLVNNCKPPSGSTVPCKTPVGQPPFPEATFVKGPSLSSLVAFVYAGLQAGGVYDLLFLSKPQYSAGIRCDASTVVIGGPVVVSASSGIGPTVGTIPANSPLGGGQICFADRSRAMTSSIPAVFKVAV